MRVVFPYRGSEALGVEALMAFLDKRGHETVLVFDPATFSGSRGRDIPLLARWFETSPQTVADYLLDLDPGVLAFSAVTGIYKWSLEVAKAVRKRKFIPTVFGGIHATAAPSSVIAEDAVDAIVLGEGEGALLELVECATRKGFARTDVLNTWVRKNGETIRNPVRPYIEKLDELPFQKKSAFYDIAPVMSRNYLVMTSRGCPNDCTYCCNHIIHELYGTGARHVRRRSPSNVVMELELARERWGIKFVEFWDDIFTQDLEWLEEFAPLYKNRVGIPFQCYAHPIFLDDRRARSLAEAGCTQVKIGVQSLDDNTLHNTLHRPGSRDAVRRAISAAHSVGIRVSIEHLLDIPGEGPDTQQNAAKFYMETCPDKIASFWLVYYPGTAIGRTAVEKGILSETDLQAIDSGDDRFTYTFMFPGNEAAQRRNRLRPYQTLFDMLPWLPERWAKWLIESGLVNRLPHWGILHQALMIVNALRINEREDIQALRYVLSRKRTPFRKARNA